MPLGNHSKAPAAHNFSYYGTEGTVINDRLFLDRIPHVKDFMQIPVPKVVEPHYVYCAVLDHYLNCIESGARPRIDALDGARTVAACCAVAESIASGRPAKVQRILDADETAKPVEVAHSTV